MNALFQNTAVRFWAESTLHAYGQIFFTRHRPASLLVLLTTFVYWPAGLAGLASVVGTHLLARLMGYGKDYIGEGLWGMNALLVTLSLASLYELNAAMAVVLVVSVVFTLLWSVSLTQLLARFGLPALSLPFLMSIWAILLAARQYEALWHSESGIFRLNELYRVGGSELVGWYEWLSSWPLPLWLDTWLRSLAAIIFQENLLSGLLLTLALLLSSRIATLMALAGFLSGFAYYHVVGADITQLSYTYIGFNFILTAIALGAFFFIPSWRTFLLAVLAGPVIAVAIAASVSLFALVWLPIYSLPFVAVVLLVLYSTASITHVDLLPRPAVQTYSPEANLYAYTTYLRRFAGAVWHHIYLPFMGEWTVTQGHDGPHTHRGPWRHAWDFEVQDSEGRTWRNDGSRLEDYYCYNLPVLAPADGYVAEVIDHVPDNAPGQVNLRDNWGNAIVIRHAEGLYTNLAHLRAGTIEVQPGQYVRRGQVLARLGNSGRSPVPHLHMQVQATPWTGSHTIEWPIAAWMRLSANEAPEFHMYDIPREGDTVSNVEPHPWLLKAFALQPGQILRFGIGAEGPEREAAPARIEEWEVKTWTDGRPYLLCRSTGSTLTFYRDDTVFYCTAFTGQTDSLLYHFYLAATRMVLGFYPRLRVHDHIPLHQVARGPGRWLHDLAAPFYQYREVDYELSWPADTTAESSLVLEARVHLRRWRRRRLYQHAQLHIGPDGLRQLICRCGTQQLRARRLPDLPPGTDAFHFPDTQKPMSR